MRTGPGLALLAGVLSTLSPCVLPLLPIVLGTAAEEHRLGPAALACGLALSFVGIGLFAATIGYAVGIEEGPLRMLAAAAMAGFGLVLLAPPLQAGLAAAGGPLGNWAQEHLVRWPRQGWLGQLMVGLLLGIVWSPCVGPTLGAASVLAARRQDLAEVALTMALFGLGAAAPLMLLGSLSRRALMRWRGRLAGPGAGLRGLFGLTLVAMGGAVIVGLDRRLEAWLVAASPDWLTTLTTRF